jgi:hypothetical protein
MRKVLTLLVFAALLGAFVACSSSKPEPSSSETKPQQTTPKTETLTGREVFQKLYVAARGWAPDIKPFHIESEPTPDDNGQDGKAAIWRVSFASPSRRSLKTFLWSGTDQGGASRGLTPGTEDTYNPANSSTQVFDTAFLKVDSDKAFSVAQEHGGEKITSKDPKQTVSYTLAWNPTTNKLIWHVAYGTGSEAKLTVSVDATTGQFLRVEK